MTLQERLILFMSLENFNPEMFQEVLGQLLDLMEYNGDDTYLDIIQNLESKKVWDFLQDLSKE